MLQKKDIETLRMLFSSHNYIMTTAELTASKLYYADTVSYTHLDVYKRQVYKRGELCMDPVSGNLHVSSNLAEVAACIITDFIF